MSGSKGERSERAGVRKSKAVGERELEGRRQSARVVM